MRHTVCRHCSKYTQTTPDRTCRRCTQKSVAGLLWLLAGCQ